jgi:hypothetical protein
MNETKKSKILQIVAAQPGWKAVYCQESENKQVKISNQVVICWALVQATGADDTSQTEVKGIVQVSNHLGIAGDLISAEKIGAAEMVGKQYLLGYNDPDAHKESDYWLDQAKVRLQSEKVKTA